MELVESRTRACETNACCLPLQVVKENLRPEIPRSCPAEYAMLIKDCWAANPRERPDFQQILARLEHIRVTIPTLRSSLSGGRNSKSDHKKKGHARGGVCAHDVTHSYVCVCVNEIPMSDCNSIFLFFCARSLCLGVPELSMHSRSFVLTPTAATLLSRQQARRPGPACPAHGRQGAGAAQTSSAHSRGKAHVGDRG